MTATPSTDRRLVVYDGNTHEFHAIPPNDATGIPLTAFQVVSQIPVAGTNIGEAIFVESIRAAYVWDGRLWREVTASPIRNFPDELILQADTTEPIGTYAVALNTGGMFVRVAGGWRRIGISEFATYTDLNNFHPPDQSQAVANDLDVVFLRLTEGGVARWVPISQMVKPKAQILATPNIAGLVAIATDTGDQYVNNGTRWVQDPIEHYPTEAALLAATPINGHIAWPDDTNVVFVATNGAWRRLAGPEITYAPAKPSTPGAGDVWWDGNQAGPGIEMYTGTEWKVAASWGDLGVGSIQQSLLTEAQFATAMGADAAKWVLADGRSVAGSRYAAITGKANVPDLRGAFFRAAGQNSNNQANWNGNAVGTWHNDTTRKPRNTAFTADSAGAHTHTITYGAAWVAAGQPNYPAYRDNSALRNWESGSAGNHTHTISGGDAETAPSHFSLLTYIRIN